jgi:hypothetical protein
MFSKALREHRLLGRLRKRVGLAFELGLRVIVVVPRDSMILEKYVTYNLVTGPARLPAMVTMDPVAATRNCSHFFDSIFGLSR